MKIEVVARFVHRGVRVRHPGEVLDVAPGEGEYLIQRGIAKAIETPKPPKPKAKKEEGITAPS